MLSELLYNELCQNGTCAVVASVISSDGNGPARKGDRLLWADGHLIAGTIGGGSNEQQILQACARLSSQEQIIEVNSFLPGTLPSCGGTLQIKLTKIDFTNAKEAAFWQKELSKNAQGQLYLMGAGHVAREVAWLADRNDFQLHIVDPRNDLLQTDRFPDSCSLYCESGNHFFSGHSPSTKDFIIIAGPDHATDLAVLEHAATTSAQYIGVMGNTKKIDSFQEILKKKKLWQAVEKRLHAPIGIKIPSKTPSEVAVSIVAELIQVRAHSIKQ
jgi:xanthine dehydrogenase accessory factor